MDLNPTCTYVDEDLGRGEFEPDFRRRCWNGATYLVNGAPRCAEHTPTVEPITPEAFARLEDDAFAAEVASARPPRPRYAPGWRARARDDAFTDDDWEAADDPWLDFFRELHR